MVPHQELPRKAWPRAGCPEGSRGVQRGPERSNVRRVAEKAVEKPAEAPTAPEDPWGLFSEEVGKPMR